jgi:hypothetical protein
MAAASKGGKLGEVKRFAGVVAGLVTLFGALACGPSFQAIYEGNARFEHCYALEENAQKGTGEKVDCWRDWSEHYTYGQTRDRIHYATARYVALSQSANVPTDEAMMMAAPGMTPRQSTITAPAPTNAFEPPPKVLADTDGGGLIGGKALRPIDLPKTVIFSGGVPVVPDASVSASAPPPADASVPAVVPATPAVAPPGSQCTEPCAVSFRSCKGATCEKTYKACMRACFK